MVTPLETRRLFEELLGCKWTLAILAHLRAEVVRPGRLLHGIPGLTPKVMQQRLRKLERFALIERQQIRHKPLHVEYRLTRKGRELVRLIGGIQRYAERWAESDDTTSAGPR